MALDLSADHRIQHQGNTTVLFDQRLLKKCPPELFSARYWQQQQLITGSAQGRGTTWFIRMSQAADALRLCLRHYRRGGLIGRLIQDRYLNTGYRQSRVYREFALLAHLNRLGLPAPRPVAGLVQREGPFYRADLLIETIDGAQDLVGLLSKGALDKAGWQQIGALVHRFHAAGVWHADLNAHNIMRDQDNNWWLIDFDRGQLRRPAERWQQANLQRLLRSLHKESGRITGFQFAADRDWPQLLAGYQQARR